MPDLAHARPPLPSREATGTVTAVLLTSGDPGAPTGGSLYHRRVAERSSRFGVELSIRSVAPDRDPRAYARGADIVVIDSILAATVRANLGDVPVVASVHQRPGGLGGPVPFRLLRASLDRRRYRRADAVVVPSPYLRSVLAGGRVPPDRVHVVEPGCDPVPGASGAAVRPGAAVSFVSVVNLVPHKRPLDLIEAFSKLGDLEADLAIVGAPTDGRLASRVAARLSAGDLRGRARWAGPLDPQGVSDALSAADVFVSASLEESYGMAVAEAMRAGLPVVVTDGGNLPKLVRHGVEGLVVHARDVEALVGAMRRLATDRAARGAMARAAERRSRSFPTWDQTAERFCGVLRSVLVGVETDRSTTSRTSAA